MHIQIRGINTVIKIYGIQYCHFNLTNMILKTQNTTLLIFSGSRLFGCSPQQYISADISTVPLTDIINAKNELQLTRMSLLVTIVETTADVYSTGPRPNSLESESITIDFGHVTLRRHNCFWKFCTIFKHLSCVQILVKTMCIFSLH